jgi:hypothetical protein
MRKGSALGPLGVKCKQGGIDAIFWIRLSNDNEKISPIGKLTGLNGSLLPLW